MKSPILFLVFNRLDETIQSFATIRKAKPSKLYISADGPRSSIAGELEICNRVRRFVTDIDWDCEVFTLFRDENLGCRNAIIDAINWFFENESEGIIIEDDVIPNDDFFSFCDIQLERFRDNGEIKAINGFNQFGQNISSNTYFFSRGFYPWGWATWKSRWQHYKADNIPLSRLDDTDLRQIYHKATLEGVKFNLNIINQGILDTWDYQMVYMIMNQKGFVVTPYANLTSNIGVNGSHSTNNKNIFFKYGQISIDQIEHPKKIEDDINMNEKLWEEYKEALFGVRVKGLLLQLKLYSPLKFLYKRMMKYYLSYYK